MKDLIVTLIVAVLGSGATSSLVSYLLQRRAEKKKKYTGAEAGVRMILYDRIKFLGLKYSAEGFVYDDSLKDLVDMHAIYHNELGGNGFLDQIMEQVKGLPIKRRNIV